jgi:hypothetical protein
VPSPRLRLCVCARARAIGAGRHGNVVVVGGGGGSGGAVRCGGARCVAVRCGAKYTEPTQARMVKFSSTEVLAAVLGRERETEYVDVGLICRIRKVKAGVKTRDLLLHSRSVETATRQPTAA